jgi:hypothetical protein
VVFGSAGVDSDPVEFGSEMCRGGGKKGDLMLLARSVDDD